MKKLLLIFIFIFEILANEVKISTYNVENLFDGKFVGSEYSDFKKWDDKDYEKKLKNIAKILKDLNADIIALQEIENDQVLKDLSNLLGYKFHIFTKQKQAPIGLGLISKIPFKNSKIHEIKNIKTRNILQVDFDFKDTEISFFVVHFPAGGYKNIESKKRAAAVLKNSVKNTKNSILLGDFNSNYGPNFILDNFFDDYINLWKELPAKSRISHISGSAIDNILISKNIYKFYKKGSFFVKNPSFFETNPSDHYPLSFVLNLEQKQENFKKQEKISTINEIYGKNLENFVLIKDAVVTFADNFGFVLSQKDKKGIYVRDKNNGVKIGETYDILLKQAAYFKGNYQILDYEIIEKKYSQNPQDFMLNVSELKTARSGDVIDKISGDLKNGYLSGDFGKIRVFSYNKKLQNGKNLTFFGGRIMNYKNEMEIIVD